MVCTERREASPRCSLADALGAWVYADGSEVRASRVVLAMGHSARDMYRRLVQHDVLITPKPFAMGFRIEHPQALVNRLQYGEDDASGESQLRGGLVSNARPPAGARGFQLWATWVVSLAKPGGRWTFAGSELLQAPGASISNPLRQQLLPRAALAGGCVAPRSSAVTPGHVLRMLALLSSVIHGSAVMAACTLV